MLLVVAHADVHIAAAVDANGSDLGVEAFAATPARYAQLHGWPTSFGPVDRVGVAGIPDRSCLVTTVDLVRQLSNPRGEPNGPYARLTRAFGASSRHPGSDPEWVTEPALRATSIAAPFAEPRPFAIAHGHTDTSPL